MPAAVRHGAFIAGADLFDSGFFSVSPAEALAMDPQQRLLLEFGYLAFHSFGTRRDELQGADCSIFLGIMNADFALLRANDESVYAATGSTISIAAGRLSFTLGVQGACASVDTACSSAVVALHAAAQALRSAECTTALTLATSLMLQGQTHVVYARAGMLSPDGRCKTFDARANGYARGEGVGTLVLSAQQQGAHLLGGCAIRSDGRSASLTAPNGLAQTRMIGAALNMARVGWLKLVEAHGTGTSLGDATEVRSLERALDSTLPCMGSIKANIGHCEPAAGLAGILALVFRGQQANGLSVQLRILNQMISSPLRSMGGNVPTQVTQVRDDGIVGGVSSFGYSGTIAHAVLAPGRDQISTLASLSLGDGSAAPSQQPVRFKRSALPWRERPHPFLQRRLRSSSESEVVFRTPTAGAMFALVAEHMIQSRVMFPGAGHLELARAACSAAPLAMPQSALHGIFFLQPLAMGAPGVHVECTTVAEQSGGARGRFEVRSGTISAAVLEEPSIHCSGETALPGMATASLEMERQRSAAGPARARTRRGTHSMVIAALYDRFHQSELQYGPKFRRLLRAWAGGGGGVAVARLKTRKSCHGTKMHPADLDGALQLSMPTVLTWKGAGSVDTKLPFAVDQAQLESAAGEMWAVRSCLTSTRVPVPCCILLTCSALLPRAGCGTAGSRSNYGATRRSQWLLAGRNRGIQSACTSR